MTPPADWKRSHNDQVLRSLIQNWVAEGKREVAFIEAIRYSLTDLVDGFLEQGMPVNETSGSSNGSSPLMMAAFVGNHRLIKKLLDLGADVHIRNENETTALHAAVAGLNREAKVIKVVKLLLEAGADKTVVDDNGETPCCYAKDKFSDAVVSLLSE